MNPPAVGVADESTSSQSALLADSANRPADAVGGSNGVITDSHDKDGNSNEGLVMSPGGQGSDAEKQQAIRDELSWSWKAYEKYAWGKDEVLPVSGKGHEWFGIGLRS